MLDALYKDYLMDKSEQDPNFSISLKIQGGNLPKTTKIGKKMDEETQEKTRQANEEIRLKRKEMVEPVAEAIGKFKMNFISAPIRRAMMAAMEKKQLPPVEVKYRSNEKYWVMMPENNTVQVYYSVNFSNSTDISLARTMLLEWESSMQKISGGPIIKFSDK